MIQNWAGRLCAAATILAATTGAAATNEYYGMPIWPLVEFVHPKIQSASSNLSDLYVQAGFNPHADGASIIAVISDVHIDPRYLQTTNIDDRIVNLINEMNPLPQTLIVCGDLAISHTVFAGAVRTAEDMEYTRWELSVGLQELQRFGPAIDVRIIPGNHDTDAQEVTPDLWSEVMGDRPAYQRFDRGGLPVFLLNGGHSGVLDPDQQVWLADEVQSLPSAQDVLLFVHQPPLSRIDMEREIKPVLLDVFGDREGTLWVVSGHVHRFGNEVYRLGETRAVQTVVTTANPKAYSNGTNPGLALICITDGQISARIIRDAKTDFFELLEPPENLPMQDLVFPYRAVDFPLLALEEGKYEQGDYLESAIANHTGTWWSYLGRTVFRLPLADYGGKATHVTALGSADRAQYLAFRFSTEPDPSLPGGIQVPRPSSTNAVYEVPIPTDLRGEAEIYFEVSSTTNRFYSGIRLGGIGLSSTGANLAPIEQWMSRHFMSIRNEGVAAMTAAPGGDGICNLLKYAFGLDPWRYDVRYVDLADPEGEGGLPAPFLAGQGDGIRVGLGFARRPPEPDPGIVYHLEQSDALDTWTPAADATVETIHTGDAWWHQTAAETAPQDSLRFYRVGVELTEELLP